MSLQITAAGNTNVGLVRSQNEDFLFLDADNDLYVVCDGMGGHQAGEVASREACNIIHYCFTDLPSTLVEDSVLALPADLPARGSLLVQSIRLANRSVYRRSRSHSDLSGMGTTVVGMAFQDYRVCIAHVGDSRAYRLTETSLIPLTTDHSWVSELQKNGQVSEKEASQIVNRNVITRALGISERVDIDFRASKISKGDIYILCTDGLCGYVDDEDIYSVASSCGKDVNKITSQLVQLANERGGQDNVTVLAARVDAVDIVENPEEITPVTISGESEEALFRENELLDSFKKVSEASEFIPAPTLPRRRGFPLWIVFLIFIALAVFFVYLINYK